MFGYFTAYITVVLCLLIGLLKDKRVDKMSFAVLALVLVCLCGFRHVAIVDVGNDTYTYYQSFLKANQTKMELFGDEHLDPAFLMLNIIIRFFTGNQYVYGFIIAFLSITPVLYLYKKVSTFPFFSIFLYVCMQVGGSSPYFMAFNQMRQALAVGWLCMAIYYYIKNDYKLNAKVIIWLVVMSLTHWSSLLMIIPFLVKRVNLGKYFYIFGMLLASVAGFFAKQFVPQLSDLFVLMEQGYYIDDEIEFSFISNIPLLFLSCYVFFISSKEECNSFEHKCLFLQFVLYGFLAPFNNSIFRFCIYYGIIGNLAMASSFYKSFKKKNAISIGVIIVAFLYISRVILISLAGLEKEFPYSVW